MCSLAGAAGGNSKRLTAVERNIKEIREGETPYQKRKAEEERRRFNELKRLINGGPALPRWGSRPQE